MTYTSGHMHSDLYRGRPGVNRERPGSVFWGTNPTPKPPAPKYGPYDDHSWNGHFWIPVVTHSRHAGAPLAHETFIGIGAVIQHVLSAMLAELKDLPGDGEEHAA